MYLQKKEVVKKKTLPVILEDELKWVHEKGRKGQKRKEEDEEEEEEEEDEEEEEEDR